MAQICKRKSHLVTASQKYVNLNAQATVSRTMGHRIQTDYYITVILATNIKSVSHEQQPKRDSLIGDNYELLLQGLVWQGNDRTTTHSTGKKKRTKKMMKQSCSSGTRGPIRSKTCLPERERERETTPGLQSNCFNPPTSIYSKLYICILYTRCSQRCLELRPRNQTQKSRHTKLFGYEQRHIILYLLGNDVNIVTSHHRNRQ